MFRRNRIRGVGWKGRISAADVNSKIGLRDWPTNWSVPVLEKPGSCLVLFFYCLFAYPQDTKVRTRLNVSARSRARMRTNNKLNPHMASTPGNKPAPHWWQASALITGPPLLPPPPPPPLSQLSCLARSGTLARQAMSPQCARQRVRKIHRCEIKSPYFFGWLKGYGPRLGTTNGSTRSSCLVSFGSSSSCFRFLLSGDSANVILKGDER